MGNRSGLIAIGSALTENDIMKASAAMAANFGSPSSILLPYFVGNTLTFEYNPEYSGTPWIQKFKLTVREKAVAKLHTTLSKLGVLNKISEIEWDDIMNISVDRLKCAKWAKYRLKRS